MESKDRIISAKSQLMRGRVGMASMLLKLKLVEDNERCKTMATDGISIYWNDEFVKTLSNEEIKAVLIHETAHVIWEHPLRNVKQKWNHDIWNIATDYVINYWIHYELQMELPKDGLLDYKWKNYSAEQVARELTNNDDALQEAIDEMKSKSDEKSDSDSDSDENLSDDSNSDEGNEDSEKSLLDELKDMNPSMGEVWMPTDDEGKSLSDNAVQELREAIQRTINLSDKLESFSNSGSSALGGVMNQLNATPIDWVDVMRDFLTTSYSSSPNWNRLNKRHSWRGINLPSKNKEPRGGELILFVDTSCSVTQAELDICATNIYAVCDDCGIDKVRVAYCDTTVHKNYNTGEFYDSFELDNEELVLKYRGGGGTRFEPCFNLFNEHTDDTEDVIAIIYFTDGYCDVDADVEPNVPVIWALSGKSEIVDYYNLPFGEKILIDMSEL